MAVTGSIPKVMGIKTTIAVTPLNPGIAPKIIPMTVPASKIRIPRMFNIILSVAQKTSASNIPISLNEQAERLKGIHVSFLGYFTYFFKTSL
jgi:hypothetical protein